MVTQIKPDPVKSNNGIPGRPHGTLTAGLSVVTGTVLPTLHAEIAEAIREIQQSRLTIQAMDRLCATRPELRGELVAQMNQILDEQKAAAAQAPTPTTKKKQKR